MSPRRGSLAGGTKLVIEGKGKKTKLLTITHIPGHTSDLQLKLRPGQTTRKVEEACQSRDLG